MNPKFDMLQLLLQEEIEFEYRCFFTEIIKFSLPPGKELALEKITSLCESSNFSRIRVKKNTYIIILEENILTLKNRV